MLFLLENPQDGPRFVCMTLPGKTLRPEMSTLSMLYLTSTLLTEMTSLTFDFCKLTPFRTNRSNLRNTIISMFSGVFDANFDWNQVKCKNDDHTFLFHCINICRVPRKMFEHSALRSCVQTTSSGPVKC